MKRSTTPTVSPSSPLAPWNDPPPPLYGLKGQTIISAIGTVLAAFFIILSFIPGSPGFLSVPSFVILIIWIVLGFIFWNKIKHNFLHGRWEGVDVEHILMSKMTDAGTIESYNKDQ